MSRYIPAFTEPIDLQLEKHICECFDLPALVARMLIRRGLREDETIEAFLEPAATPLKSPYVFPQMEAAVKRIRKAILGDELICIYGDYDADGTTATAILVRALRDLTENVIYYIPSRHSEGYGLHISSVEALAQRGVTLLITVDNGIAAHEEIGRARELGMDVIVTDHHEPQGGHPDCVAVLSAADDPGVSPLCGAGVAMKLAFALRPEADPARFLPLAAVATIADMVPLIGENRTIVAMGLSDIITIPGIDAMLERASANRNAINENTVAFCVAPRLNATGRIDDASKAVELLISDDAVESVGIAGILEDLNAQRRNMEVNTFAEAVTMADAAFSSDTKIVIVRGKGWNVGIAGIVASKLVEAYHVPALVFAEPEEGILTGSGRSIPGINLFEALTAVKEHFIRYGGHAMAAGITLKESEFDAFVADIEEYLSDTYDEAAFSQTFFYEESILPEDLSLPTVKSVGLLAPFGEKNKEPLFLMENVSLSGSKTIGKDGNHFSADVCANGTCMRAVGFSCGRYAGILGESGAYDILVSASVNAFGGTEKPELTLKHFRRHSDGGTKLVDAFFENVLYNDIRTKLLRDFKVAAEPYAHLFKGFDFSRQYMRQRYRALRQMLADRDAFLAELRDILQPAQIASLLVFIELGFFRADLKRGVVHLVKDAPGRELTESVLYQWLCQINIA